MVASASSVAKRCISCGKDVAQSKRMKDSQGRYWCVDCGMADQRKKAKGSGSVSKSGVAVAKGPGMFDRLRDVKDGFGSGGGGGSVDKGRLVKMLLAMGGLALIAAWQFLSHSH